MVAALCLQKKGAHVHVSLWDLIAHILSCVSWTERTYIVAQCSHTVGHQIVLALPTTLATLQNNRQNYREFLSCEAYQNEFSSWLCSTKHHPHPRRALRGCSSIRRDRYVSLAWLLSDARLSGFEALMARHGLRLVMWSMWSFFVFWVLVLAFESCFVWHFCANCRPLQAPLPTTALWGSHF